jgi:hypothetical protein
MDALHPHARVSLAVARSWMYDFRKDWGWLRLRLVECWSSVCVVGRASQRVPVAACGHRPIQIETDSVRRLPAVQVSYAAASIVGFLDGSRGKTSPLRRRGGLTCRADTRHPCAEKSTRAACGPGLPGPPNAPAWRPTGNAKNACSSRVAVRQAVLVRAACLAA